MERIECLSSKLLARRWGLSHRTLERWRHEGTGPAFLKIGGRVKYRLEDVQAFEKDRVRHQVAAAKPGELR
jgi:predicted site-specific integrase-resolvase